MCEDDSLPQSGLSEGNYYRHYHGNKRKKKRKKCKTEEERKQLSARIGEPVDRNVEWCNHHGKQYDSYSES